jgi:hypothetical protein
MILSVYGIRENLATWEILLQCVAAICLEFQDETHKNTPNAKCKHFFQQLDLDPNSIQDLFCQPELRPVDEV